LLNLNGEVLGINRSIRTANTVGGEASNSGVGFALPINLVKRVVPAIIKVGQFDYPYMGISTLNSELMNLGIIKELGLERMTGVYVTDVLSGGPAEKAGVVGASLKTGIEGLLSGGDLIIAVDGREVKIYDDLIGYLVEYKSPGESIVLTVLRGSETKDLTLNLIKRP
jgi:2-alkenal reductase